VQVGSKLAPRLITCVHLRYYMCYPSLLDDRLSQEADFVRIRGNCRRAPQDHEIYGRYHVGQCCLSRADPGAAAARRRSLENYNHAVGFVNGRVKLEVEDI